MARGGVRALARARRGRGRCAGRRHRRQPRLRAGGGIAASSSKLPWTYLRDSEVDARGRAPLRVALVPAPPRARRRPTSRSRPRRRCRRARSCRTGRRAGAAASSWRTARTSSPSASTRSPTASTCSSRTRRRSGTAISPPIGDHVGSTALLAAIERVQPALAVFGHIHEGRGEPTREGGTLCANSAICDRWFERRNQPWLIDVDLAAARGARARANCDWLVNTH